MSDNRLQRVVELVRDRYEQNGDPSHDFVHIERVVSNCRKLGTKAGANLEILLPAAYLHDVVNVPKNHPDRLKASEMAAREAAGLLATIGYSKNEIDQIATAVYEHSYSLGKSPSTLESAILQDADRLDALGAIGIMRTVTCAAKMATPRYYQKNGITEPVADLDDRTYTIDHFYVKLFKLVEKMNTKEARAEAEARAAFMRQFLEQLNAEA